MEDAERQSTQASNHRGGTPRSERLSLQVINSMCVFAPCQPRHRDRLQTLESNQLKHELEQGRRDAEYVAHTEYGRLIGGLGSEHPHLHITAARLEQLDQDFALEAESRARDCDLIEQRSPMDRQAVVIVDPVAA